MQNRLIDACFLGGGFPTSAVSQLYASQIPVDMVEFSDEDIAKVREVAPYFAKVIIPKGTYPKQDRDLHLMAIKSTLVVEKDVSEDIVYKMLEAIYVNKLEDLHKKHGALKTLSLEQALVGLTNVPLHPGAVKFYKDHNVEIPDDLIK
jgi:TRAP transporter TAXI family solute receptor